MADKPIRVALLEGDFAVLSLLGFPLGLTIQLQQSNLNLADALIWTAKSSKSAVSIYPHSKGISTSIGNEAMFTSMACELEAPNCPCRENDLKLSLRWCVPMILSWFAVCKCVYCT